MHKPTLLVLSAILSACHNNAPVRRDPEVAPVIRDTAGRVAPLTNSSVFAFFKDTAVATVFSTKGQIFRLRTPAERQTLHATLSKERQLWQAAKLRDYRFLLRVGCFCPGTRGWLLIDVRRGHLRQAWDKTGRSVDPVDWNTFSIEDLYDNLERAADRDSEVQIAFDPRSHFPTYIHTVTPPGPDAWSTIEVRALRPI